MEGEFNEVKRRTNAKTNEDKSKSQSANTRGAADGQDDSSTKENNNVCKNSKPTVNVSKAAAAAPVAPTAINTSGCKAQQQVKPKVFGKDFLEAPLPKVNPWTRARQCPSPEAANGAAAHATATPCSKNTNAAETSTGEAREEEQTEAVSLCDAEHEAVGKTDASQTKNRTPQSQQQQHRTPHQAVPAHSFHQANNPAYKTSNKTKQWDKKSKDTKPQNTDLNDSAQWPSLDEKNRQEQQVARPKVAQSKPEESNESDVDSQVKPGSPVPEETQDGVNNQQAMKKKSKQKWVQLPIEMKTERRRGGNRGRGSARPQYFEDQNRRNRPNLRRPNRVRDGSRPGESEGRPEENERNVVPQSVPTRGIGFRGRRGQGRGRGGYSRSQRDSNCQDQDETVQPFFAPTYISEVEVLPPPRMMVEMQHSPSDVRHHGEATPDSGDAHEVKILTQIEYYFSDRNLARDEYLRCQMNPDGWVDVSIICAFPRVKRLSENAEEVVKVMQKSALVELSEDGKKLRTKINPTKWPMKAGEELELRAKKWQAIVSNSKLKVDAPVFVPGQLYVPGSSMASSKLQSELKNDPVAQQNNLNLEKTEAQ